MTSISRHRYCAIVPQYTIRHLVHLLSSHILIVAGDRCRALVSAALSSATLQHCDDLGVLPARAAALQPALVVVGFGESDAPAALRAVQSLRRADRRLPIVLVTSDPSQSTLLAALRAGVKDYLREPFDPAGLAATVHRCLVTAAARTDPAPAATSRPSTDSGMIGNSQAMRTIAEYLGRVAQHDATVLITGETGTGKELVAAQIHQKSARRTARFVPVNCAAIPEGLIESELFGYETGAFTGANRSREGLLQLANCGTLFLDEVGDLGSQAQAKILRALETREVFRLGGKRPEKLDVRLVAATNQDVDRALDDGRFRKDLYFRLNVARIHLPPLRERRSDIVPLLDYYLNLLNKRKPVKVAGFSEDAISALHAYDWPGNVRELKNLVEAVFVSPPIRPVEVSDLPDDFRRRLQHVGNLPDNERRQLFEALLSAKWNKSKAASILRCSRMTLYRRMAKYSVTASHAAAGVSQGRVTDAIRKSSE